MITKNFSSFEVTGNFSLVNNNSNLLQTSLNDTTTITIDGREVLIIKGQTTLNLGTEQMTFAHLFNFRPMLLPLSSSPHLYSPTP